MCITNSSTMLCGISINTYLHADQSPAKVVFCRETKGRILQTLTETDMATVVVSDRPSSLPEDSSAQLFATLLRLWRACHLSGRGLRRFFPTWLHMVLELARASLKFDMASVPGKTRSAWDSDPILAYLWLKARMRGEGNQKGSSSAAAVRGGNKSDPQGKGKQKEDKEEEDSMIEGYRSEWTTLETVLDDMPTDRRAFVSNQIRCTAAGRPVHPAFLRWMNKSTAFERVNEYVGRQRDIVAQNEKDGASGQQLAELKAEFDRLGGEIDRLIMVYKKNGGHHGGQDMY